MELLAEITEKDVGIKKNPKAEHAAAWRADAAPDKDIRSYYRGAARAVVLNAGKEMALLHVTKQGYYKLPGGGIGKGESTVGALHREVMEEIGCRVGALKPIGMIIEHRERIRITQISYCYMARLKGRPGENDLEEDEKALGSEPEWWGMRKALCLVEGSGRPNYLAKFMVARDATFIRKAIRLVSDRY